MAQLLVGRGYHIIARNHRCREGEIDIVAELSGCLCFVEVRTRSPSAIVPEETVNGRKQRRIVAAARHFLHGLPPGEHAVRFDVASVRCSREGALDIELVENAFDAGA